jgi:predicted HD phosphohydrolase
LSLGLQWGTISGDEARRFLARQFACEAIALLQWDEEAKVPELPVLISVLLTATRDALAFNAAY